MGNPDNVASMPVVVAVWLNHGHSCSGSEESARGDEKAVGIHDNAEYAHDFCFVSVLFFFLGGKGLVIGLRYIDDWGDLYWL